MFEQIVEAASLVLHPQTIFYVCIGVLFGQFLGAIPGLTATMAMAMLMPLTFSMPIWVGVPMLLGMLKGALFAGSLAAILIKTPGAPASLATTFDGYPLAQQGKAKKAIKMALFSSTFGDTFGTLCLIFATGILASIAIKFGPPEYMLISLCALMILGTVTGKSPRAGIMSAGIGLFFGTIGLDPVLGISRLSFNNVELLGGIALIPLLIGLLTIPEILKQMEKKKESTEEVSITFSDKPEDNRVHWWEIRKVSRTLLRSSLIGTCIGAIPGLGASVAGILGYNQAVVSSKEPNKFGKGEIEGVAATESANSAEGGANMIPLLAFGIPGDVSVAVIASSFLVHGITVGPMVFQESPVQVYAIFIALLMASIMNFIIGQGFIPIASKVLQIQARILFPSVFIMAVAGTYGFRGSLFDVGVMMIFGIIGYVMMKLDIPVIPLIIAFIIGPMIETALRRTAVLAEAQGTYLFLLERPLFVILTILVALMVYFIINFRRKLAVGS